MSTLRELDRAFLPAQSLVRPLACAEEQARILRTVLGAGAGDGALALGDGLVLEAWERELLHREARSQDVRGEALTLLRARAAEWAVTRALDGARASGSRPAAALAPLPDAATAEAAALLLDRTLADIGGMLDTLTCAHPEGLEGVGVRLQDLYARVSEQSLMLAGCRGTSGDAPSPLLDALGDNEFELSHVVGARRGLALVRGPEADPSDDPFEIEQEVSVAAVSTVWAVPVPSREEVLVRTAAAIESLLAAPGPAASAAVPETSAGEPFEAVAVEAPHDLLLPAPPAAAGPFPAAPRPVAARAMASEPLARTAGDGARAEVARTPAGTTPASRSRGVWVALAVAVALVAVVGAAFLLR